MHIRPILLGAAASALCASAAFAERGSDGQLNILYWQAVSIMTPYLSSGTKDIQAASLVIEPLARYNEKGDVKAARRLRIKRVSWLLSTVMQTKAPQAENMRGLSST